MTRFIITAAALMVSTSAFAQVSDGKTTTTLGASSTVISVGDHYTIQTVGADGTVSVKTVVGAEALALAQAQPATIAMATPR